MTYTITMKLSPLVLAIRAIAVEFAQRIFLPIILVTGGVLVVLIGIAIWLVTMSGWWWLLLAPLIVITVLSIFATVIAGIMIRLLKPTQTRAQQEQVRLFVSSLQETSEAVQTPLFILFIRVLKDVLFPGKESYIGKLSSTAVTLKSSLQEIITSFK